jgi:hypothetical protein
VKSKNVEAPLKSQSQKAGPTSSLSSNSGTTSPVPIRGFTVKEVSAIIKAAHHLNVKELRLGDLAVVFFSRLPYGPLDKPRNSAPQESPDKVTSEPEPHPLKAIAEDADLLREMHQTQLMIDDPEAFESVMIDEQIHGSRKPDAQAQDLRSQ